MTAGSGSAGRETNRAAGLMDHSGQLWVGTDSGVSVYQKSLERESSPPPLVQLEHLLAGLVIYWAGAAMLRRRYTIRLESEVQARTAELADSESRYRLLFDNAAVAKLLIDPGPALVLEVNESACRLLGIPRGQLVGSRTNTSSSEWLCEFGCLIAADTDRTSLEFGGLQQRWAKMPWKWR